MDSSKDNKTSEAKKKKKKSKTEKSEIKEKAKDESPIESTEQKATFRELS